MFNVGGPEVLVILLVALIVLGPQQLPKAVRSVGNVMSELRRMSSGFQDEIRNAMNTADETPARTEGSTLARRPEDADITETVARHSENGSDRDHRLEPGTASASVEPASGDASAAPAKPPAKPTGFSADDHWAPSDRASG